MNAAESVALDLRPHWWFFSRQLVALFATLLIGLIAVVFDLPGWVGLIVGVLLVLSLLWLALQYVIWLTTNFVVTSDRIITRTGVLSRSGIEIPLERVNTVFFRQSIFERMIRSGDLVIESAGETGNSHFTDIRRPLEVQNEIYTQMEANENRKFALAGGSRGPDSIPEQIDQLDGLRQRGLLTDAEFEAKKTDLLRRL